MSEQGTPMDLAGARARIDEVFTADGEPNLRPSEYIELLEPIADLPNEDLARVPTQVRKFLYDGARTFDRWSTPTPPVVEPEMRTHYEAFVDTFRRCDATHPNLPLFALHELQTEVFERWGSRSLDPPPDIESSEVEDLRRRAQEVPVPPVPKLRPAFEATLSRIEGLCEALVERTVRSTLAVTLPHAVVRAPHSGRGSWRGRPFSYSLSSDAVRADGMVADGNAMVNPVGLTRAESGTCSATIELQALEDFNAWSPHLTGSPADEGSRFSTGQPWCQSVLFYVLEDLIAGLQDSDSPHVDKLWVLTPRDLSQLAIRIDAGDQTVVNIGSLMLGGWQVTVGPLEPQTVGFTTLAPSSYWLRCRRRAEGYLTLGATSEALLWLNMAVEALLDERILVITERRLELREELLSSKLLFAEAEATLTDQFPDMAGRVVWPDRVQAPSRFAQIKALCQKVPLPIKSRDATSKYSVISKSRNDVIHGRDIDRISPQAVADGLQALEWLSANLRPPPTEQA